MWSRVTYTLRETWASFKRNMTLTAAAIITSAVSLLIFGATMLMREGFDNLLVTWEDDVEMIVYVNAGTTDEQRSVIDDALASNEGVTVESFRYCPAQCSLDEAEQVLAGRPDVLAQLSLENIPSQYKVVPTEATDVNTLRDLQADLRGRENVRSVDLAEDQLDLIAKLKNFFGLYTLLLSISLLIAAVLLIWNTIRTAMFARRREIEVMKAVGATDWFIRVPFMLEGLVQGMIGGLGACGALWFINERWTDGVRDFPLNSGFVSMVVSDGFLYQRMGILMGIGALVGAIGSGIAVSRFLDV
ncbi:MAG: ABC transporter permease [Actinomycetota bacterium]|nr:ABC transporter permease [Actinomycetota bacterium]